MIKLPTFETGLGNAVTLYCTSEQGSRASSTYTVTEYSAEQFPLVIVTL
ncbi:hypothetical protein [Flavivirga aquatica]|nr:hypothetical protein [Flavivirga aquatica]